MSHTGIYESEKEAPSVGPSPIINIKKEKRETEEETKEILRSLERDNVSPVIVSRLLLSSFICCFNFPLLYAVYRRSLPEE